MKLSYTYLWGIIGILLFLGLFGVVMVLGELGFGVKAYIEATRYMSVGGKVTYFLFTGGMFVFLVKFVTARNAK